MKKVIKTAKAPAPIGPYNQAIFANGTLYISGQIPVDPSTGELKMNSIEEETDLVMKNIEAILKEADMSFQNIVKCSIFISDMANFSRINEIYSKYFDENAPARECVEVSCLPKNVNVEISAIAVA